MPMLQVGDPITIEDRFGHTARGVVGPLRGCGGQGCVFDLQVNDGSHGDLVLKWYNEYYEAHFRAEQLQAVRDLLDVDPPSDRFLWPEALAFADGNRSFGYVMRCRPLGFEGLERVVAEKANELSYDAIITFGLQVARSIQQLHTAGLAYRDINLSNFFVRPESGEALICDTDNIGYELRRYMGVRGREDFMAPEIVRGHAAPSANTDRHSLAVLLFILLVRWHPLEGRRTSGLLDDVAVEQHFGHEPLFCFDADDPRNRPPDDARHAELYWSWYPRWLRGLFERAFGDGLHDPQHGRAMESEWLEALVRLRDAMVTCGACGGLNYYDPGAGDRCRRPACGATLDAPQLLDVALGPGRTRQLAIEPGRRLHGYHIRTGYSDIDPIGTIVRHPTDATACGLVNESGDDWSVRFSDGVVETLHHGEGVLVEQGLTIHAGDASITARGGTRG